VRPVVAILLVGLLFWRVAHAERIVAVYIGISHTFASDLRVRQPASGSDVTFESVSWAPHPLTQGAPYYGLRFSYFPARAPHTGAAVDFTHYKMYAETAHIVRVRGTWNGVHVDDLSQLSARLQHLEVSHGVNLTSINAQFRWSPALAKGIWARHIGAGLLVYSPHAEGAVGNTAVSGGYQYGGFGGQVFGGAEYGLSSRFGLLIEGKFDIGRLELDLEPRTRIETSVRTLHLIGGVGFHF